MQKSASTAALSALVSGRMVACAAGILLLLGDGVHAQNQPLDIATALTEGRVTVEHSPLDIGSIERVFDSDTGSLARSAAVNPMVVTLLFTEPVVLARSRVWFLGGSNRWRVETADSIVDLDAGTGSFRAALDWATEGESAWRDRTLIEPVTCRVVRLQLERLFGDDYVHLNEWQLFRQDIPFAVTSLFASEGRVALRWNASIGQWYEVLQASSPVSWSGNGFHKAEAAAATHEMGPPTHTVSFFAVREALPEERSVITRRVLVVNIDPVLEAYGGQRLNAYQGWNDPHVLTTNYFADLTAASGGYVQWEIAEWVDLDLWPRKADGFAYDDETYLQLPPLYVVMGLNPERGVAEALHSFGHRCESTLRHVYGSWSSTATVHHLWDRFTRIGPLHGVSVAGCGNVHFPPNAGQDYAYDVATPVDASNAVNHGKLNDWWAYLVDMNEYAESR